MPAIINDDTIFWAEFISDRVVESHINRVTGSIVVDSIDPKAPKGGGFTFAGTCAAVTERKF